MRKASFFVVLVIGVSLLLVQDTEAGSLAMRLASYPYMPIWTTGTQADAPAQYDTESQSEEDVERQWAAARAASKRVRHLLDRLYAGRR
uniref:Uncharacterized protein n=1 Tax=Plectus sambesii TaxID=2011161 RepID=A0A914W0C9_9BILA